MKVEFLDADSGSFIHEQVLTFDPRLSRLIELTKRGEVYGQRLFEIDLDKSRLCLATNDPEKTKLMVYMREVKK